MNPKVRGDGQATALEALRAAAHLSDTRSHATGVMNSVSRWPATVMYFAHTSEVPKATADRRYKSISHASSRPFSIAVAIVLVLMYVEFIF